MPITLCQCGNKCQFPDSAIGKKARCRKCGQIFVIEVVKKHPPPEPAAERDGSIFDDLPDDFFRKPAPAAAVQETPSQTPPPPTDRFVDKLPAPSPTSGFAKDVLWTFLFPASIGKLATVIVITVAFLVASFLPFASFFVGAWFSAYLFSIIESSAGGDEDMPYPTMSDGFTDDLILPVIRWIGSWIVVFLPVGLYVALRADSGGMGVGDLIVGSDAGLAAILSLAGEEPVAVGLMLLGIFLWPMVVLCVALGGFSSLYRLDLILKTIVMTFPPYAITVGLIVAAGYLEQFLFQFAGTLAFLIAMVGIGIYLDMVTARLIGLYYHRFKHRFAWDWG